MLPRTRQAFIQRDSYLPILAETLTAKRAEGRTKGTLYYYREKLNIFLAWCDTQVVTQIEQIDAQLLRRFLLAMSETHNAGGVHGIYRAVRAFLRWIEFEELIPAWQSPTRKVKAPKVSVDPIEGVVTRHTLRDTLL